MKTKISFIAIIIMAFVTIAAVPVPGTNQPAHKQSSGNGFGFIRSHRQGNGAEVSWSFTDNATSFTLMRTYEDPTDPYAFWEAVTSAPADGSRSYKIKDTNVFPGTISYQVLALLQDGSTEVSDVSSMRIAGK
jgi:hypothetical protein